MSAFQRPVGRPGGEVYRGPGAAFSPHGFPQAGASSDNIGNREGEGALERKLSPELAQHPPCQAESRALGIGDQRQVFCPWLDVGAPAKGASSHEAKKRYERTF